MKWLRLFNDNIREIEYFSESGKGMPNGSHIQRGGFLTECYRNAIELHTPFRECDSDEFKYLNHQLYPQFLR